MDTILTLKYPINEQQQEIIHKSLLKENIARAELYTYFIIFFELMMVAINYIINDGFVMNRYLVMYFILLFVGCCMIIFTKHVIRNQSEERHSFAVQSVLFSFYFFCISWGIIVTVFDQEVYGHVMAFVVNSVCAVVLYHTSSRLYIALHLPTTAALFILLNLFQDDQGILFGHLVNLFILMIFCWLCGRMFYVNFCSKKFLELELAEVNQSLLRTIVENEKMNSQLVDLNKELKEIIVTDELTKVANRRGFFEWIERRLRDGEQQLAIFMMDVDYFKLFNDFYGHVKGDKALYIVAQKVKQIAEKNGFYVARYGGEEFVIAGCVKTTDNLAQIGQDICKGIQRLNIEHKASVVSDVITVSLGMATSVVSNVVDVDELLSEADEALYIAKKQGRNQIKC